MDQVSQLYDSVIKTVLHDLEIHFEGYGWEHELIHDKLASLERLWRANLDHTHATSTESQLAVKPPAPNPRRRELAVEEAVLVGDTSIPLEEMLEVNPNKPSSSISISHIDPKLYDPELGPEDDEPETADTVTPHADNPNFLVGKFLLDPFKPSKSIDHTKGRWKLTLSNCILHTGGRDYIIRQAVTELY